MELFRHWKKMFFLILIFSLPLEGKEDVALKTTAFLAEPPSGWGCVQDPTQLPGKVKVIFVGKSTLNGAFTPSINVACEETSQSLSEYVLLAKKYHESQGGTKCVHLGKIKTVAGIAEALQIDRPSQWGEVRFLQAIYIEGTTAYVVTATCLKNQFSALSNQFVKAIQSLTLPAGVS